MKTVKGYEMIRQMLFRPGDRLSFREFHHNDHLGDGTSISLSFAYHIHKVPKKRSDWYFAVFTSTGHLSTAHSWSLGTKRQAKAFLNAAWFERSKLNGQPIKQRQRILDAILKRAMKT